MPLLKTRREETSHKDVVADAAKDAQVAARIDSLLRRVNVRDAQPNPGLVWELKSLGDAALPLIVAALRRHIAGHRRWTRFALIGVGTTLFALMPIAQIFGAEWWPFNWTALCWLLAAVMFLTAWYQHALQAADLRLSMRMNDPLFLGLLIDEYENMGFRAHIKGNSETLSGEVRAALLHLLPRLDAAGEDLLDDRRRRNLRCMLRSAARHPFLEAKADSELAFAAVKALVQIRDLESLETLRRLARKAYDPDVRAIAARGVAELEAGPGA